MQMTSGVLFGLAIAVLAVVIGIGLMRRNRASGGGLAMGGDSPISVAQWTEGETTRLLSSAEVPGLYLLRPRFPPIHSDDRMKPYNFRYLSDE